MNIHTQGPLLIVNFHASDTRQLGADGKAYSNVLKVFDQSFKGNYKFIVKIIALKKWIAILVQGTCEIKATI